MVVAWNWGTSHRLVFPSSPPSKPQKPLKAQCKPALPGRAWGCEGGKNVGSGQPAGPILLQRHPSRAILSGKPESMMRTTFLGSFLGGPGLGSPQPMGVIQAGGCTSLFPQPLKKA